MPDIAVTYPLSPLQQGMLFHALSAPASGVDIEQVICTVHHPLDPVVFRKAWETVVSRHAILRSHFEWDAQAAPQQVARSNMVMDWLLEDWQELSPVECTERLERFLELDRRRDFSMDRGPLMRLAIFKCGPDVHQCVWTFHHAILDGRSFPIVLSEVFESYRALQAGEEPDLPSPVPFGSFLEWLRERPRDHEESFWREELKGFTAPTIISFDENPGPGHTPGPQLASQQRLSAALTSQLQSAADTLSVTINTFVQSAWALLLSHYSGHADEHRDVVFGTTRACRYGTVPDAESMIGICINTVPLRVSWEAGTTTRDLLLRVRGKHLALRPVEHTPLSDIQRWSTVPAPLPLFDSIVVFEKQTLNDLLQARGGAWEKRSFEYRGQTNFPLALIAYGGEELLLRIESDSNRFDGQTTARILGHLCQLLQQMAHNLDAPVDALSYLTPAESQGILIDWNQTKQDYPTDVCLHELFEQQVAISPDAVALIFDEQQLTYGQLNARANQLAHFLREQGVLPDTRVGVFMHRGFEMVISLYAILKAGGAYVPLDPDYPNERLTFMLEDSSCDLILTQSDLTETLSDGAEVRRVAVDGEWSMIDRRSAENLSRRSTATNLAYVIYTSGSTGRPKGVMNEHGGICNRLFWMQEAFGLTADDRVLQKTPFSFDVSVWEFFWPLLFGAKLVIARPDGHRDPDYLAGVIQESNITTIHFVPSMLDAFLRADNVEACSCLRRVICSGEALGYESQERFFQRLDAELHNLYGPTEAAVDVTHWACRRSDRRQLVPIGKPIANTQVYVLDSALHPVPIGVPGELHIGGVQVARGYLNRPELTAEKFISDPFSETPNARLYKTGDSVRFLADGNVEYLGRLDHQVKIRGFRIELSEIESVLAGHPSVLQCIVMAREDTPGDKRLTAYIERKGGAPEANVSELRTYLKTRLPEYMIPVAFVFQERFSLTHNGKVDRKALPAPDDQRPELADRFVAPRTLAEEHLASIWRDVLRLEQVGVHDNYFELGGDSIQSTLVISAARKIGLRLTPKQLFEYPTIAELAVVAVPDTETIAIDQRCLEGECPLTPIQHWFFEQQLAQPQHFNQAFLFDTRTALDHEAFHRAMQIVQHHHDALRLRYRIENGRWHQEFAAPDGSAPPLDCVDLSSVTDAQLEAELARVGEDFQSGLNLDNGPLWRVVVIKITGGRSKLLVVVHHLAIDGVSWRILLEDLEKGYQQALQGKEIILAPKTTSFRDWAERLQHWTRGDKLAREHSHWDPLARLEPLPLPRDSWPNGSVSGDGNTEANARTVTVRLTEQESQDLLQRVPKAYNTMINDVLLTALGRSIESWTGNRQVLLNLEGHGREDLFEGVDLTRSLGWFTTIYPVQLDMPESGAPQDALKAVKEQLRSVPNRGIGYGVLRYLAAERELTIRPESEPEIIFNYFGKFDDVVRDSQLFEFSEQTIGGWRSPQQRRKHVLDVNCMIIRECLEIQWTYSSSLHRRETIEAIAEEFLRSLRELIRHCASSDAGGYTPSDFPLSGLDQAAIDDLLQGSRDIQDIYPPSPIQLLFLARAAGQTSEILDHWQCVLTGDLDVKAFQLAWHDVLNCHSVLRTSIRSEGLNEPLQFVHRHVSPQWRIEDWTNRPADEHQESWEQLLREDQAIGMQLDQPPLSRFTLVRFDGKTHRFVWTVPSLLLDGWSWPLVFADVSRAYQAHLRGEKLTLDRARTYRDYLTWLRDHAARFDEAVVDFDGTRVESQREFWQSVLEGVHEPTPLLSEPPSTFELGSSSDSNFARIVCRLEKESIDRLQETVRNRRTTIGALVQAAWSVVLSRLSGRQDVIFGAAFSGRPTELAGSDSMVGPFVNNLPVRANLTHTETLGELLNAAHDRLVRLNPHQFVPLPQVQSWSDVPWQHRLFDSLVVVQNYVINESARHLGAKVSIEEFEGPIHTNFPLLVLVEPDASWRVSMIFDRRRIAPAAAQRWKKDLIRVLNWFAGDLDVTVAEVTASLSEPVAAELAHRKLFVQSQNYLPPSTPTQSKIANVWRKLIQLDRISIDDNLFDLGVQSLLVVQLHKKLQEDLGKQIGLVTLFRYPSIAALAEHLDDGDQVSDRLAKGHDRGQRQRERLAAIKNARARVKR